jgi:uncharacterized protein YggE
MTRSTRLILILLALALGGAVALRSGRALAQGPAAPDAKRTISTSGSAMVRVHPDSGRVFFGVQSLASTVKGARGDNSARTEKVLAALGALKIPDLKLKSSDVRVELVQTQERNDQLPRIIGYRVTHSFTVLVQNQEPEKLSALTNQVLDTALDSGANMVEQVVFFKQDDRDARREALSKAVQDGTANAEALSAGAKRPLGDTIRIDGAPQYSYGGNRAMAQTNGAFGGGSETPLVAGDLEVTCQVSVTCSF